MLNKEGQCTVKELKEIFDRLSELGFGDMPIYLGTNTPLLDGAIHVDYDAAGAGSLYIKNTYYDTELVNSMSKAIDGINAVIENYISDCYRAGKDIKPDDKECESILDWAKIEVKIACEKGNLNAMERASYESALKTYKSLCNDKHRDSEFSIKMTQPILNRLIDGLPLTPIEDTDDIWRLIGHCVDGTKIYQCKRMRSLFKEIYADGTVKYNDIDSSYCVNIYDPNDIYHFGMVGEIIDEMFPITMPYMPGKPIKVYCEEFLTDKKNGDSDTIGVFYAFKTENDKKEKIEINRFFREPEGDEEGSWTEISKEEYRARKARRII